MIRLIQKQWLGQDIVAWCDNEGTICVAQSVCPHLGSSLGPAAGGRVRDGHLVCPFHGFTYDVTGICVATPYAELPASVRLKVFDTREILGLVFAWWGIDGRPPQWHLPDEPSAGGEWSGMELLTLRFPGHPQETTENSVDLAHLRYVHGYDDVKAVGSATVDGALLVLAGVASISGVAGASPDLPTPSTNFQSLPTSMGWVTRSSTPSKGARAHFVH